MLDTLYSLYRNQQKARRQAGLTQNFSTGLPVDIPNDGIPRFEGYGSEQGKYGGPVPMLPPEVARILTPSNFAYSEPPALPVEQPDMAPQETPQQTLPDAAQVATVVNSLGEQARPTDSPSGASIHDEAMSQINAILGSQDPQTAWQEAQDLPFWQNNSLYSSLGALGLSLLSGATPIEAFNNAEAARQSQTVKDQLKNNRAYLLERYTADSVANAIASGDTKALQPKQISQKDQIALELAKDDLNFARRREQFDYEQAAKGEDPGSWTSGGNGLIFNTRTGAVMNIGGNTASDAPTEELKPYKDATTGAWMVPALNKGKQTGDYKVANAAEQKNLETNAVLDSAGDDTIKQLESTNGVINQIEGHDAFGRSFGAVQGRLPNITEGSQEVVSLFNQLFSQQFLDNIKLMQGMGALSNAEGAKISAAQAALLDKEGNLNQTLSEDFVKKQLNIIKETNEAGLKKLKEKQKERKGALSSDTPSSPFDASQVRIIRN